VGIPALDRGDSGPGSWGFRPWIVGIPALDRGDSGPGSCGFRPWIVRHLAPAFP